MRSAGQHGDIVATVAAAPNEASERSSAARRWRDARPGRHRVASDVYAKFASFSVAHMVPPTGASGLPFALLDDGNGKHVAEHGGTLNVVTVDGGIPITFAKAVYAQTFGFDILSAGVMKDSAPPRSSGSIHAP